jgi:rubrerythrin
MSDLIKRSDADRPQGEWKRRLVDNGFNADWVCSECGYRVKTDFVSFNYCPNCGCRMKGASDERMERKNNCL